MKLKMRLFVEVFDVDTNKVFGKIPLDNGENLSSDRLRVDLGGISAGATGGTGAGAGGVRHLRKLAQTISKKKRFASSAMRDELSVGVKELKKTNTSIGISRLLGVSDAMVNSSLRWPAERKG